ncbi:hypothetical protein Tco_1351671 [Tanacetum coccineum]
MEVFMDDFSVFGNSFRNCLSRVEKMLQRCEDTDLCLNWEKSHFMVKDGIVLGHKISKNGIEVDKAKVDVIAKLPHPTNVKGVRSFLGYAGLSWIFEASRARDFVLRSQELQILSFIWEIQYPNLIDKRLSLSILNKRLRIYVETLLKILRTMFNSSMGGSIDLIVLCPSITRASNHQLHLGNPIS